MSKTKDQEHPLEPGTRACYVQGCRLPVCVEANRRYQREYMSRRRAEEKTDEA